MEDVQREALSKLLKDILSGTANLGLDMLPALAAFTQYKKENGWKESAFSAWITSDPTALPLLTKVMEKIKKNLPETARMGLIIALGGIPHQ